MKRNLFIYISVILLSVLTCPGILFANSSTSGNTVTVNRDSGFNALRSPALMSWQKDDSMGLGFVYSFQAYYNLDATLSDAMSTLPVNGDNDSIINCTGLFSCVLRFDRHSFGFGIRSADDSQFAKSESRTSIEGAAIDTEENRTLLNISSVLSYSCKFSNRQSIGLQIETGYGVKEINKVKNESGTQSETEEDTEKLSGSVTIGYFLLGNNFEVGLMVKGGEFASESIESRYDVIAASSTDEEIGPQIYQNKGYSLVAGFAYRLSGRLLLNFEAGGEIPYEYDRESLSDTAVRIDNNIRSTGAYMAKLGADYVFSRSISGGIGGSYTHASSESESSNGSSTSSDINLLEITTGFEYRFLSGIQFLFSCNLLYVMADMETAIPPVTKLHLDQDSLNINFVTGVSMNF